MVRYLVVCILMFSTSLFSMVTYIGKLSHSTHTLSFNGPTYSILSTSGEASIDMTEEIADGLQEKIFYYVYYGKIIDGVDIFINGEKMELDKEGRFKYTTEIRLGKNTNHIQVYNDKKQISEFDEIIFLSDYFKPLDVNKKTYNYELNIAKRPKGMSFGPVYTGLFQNGAFANEFEFKTPFIQHGGVELSHWLMTEMDIIKDFGIGVHFEKNITKEITSDVGSLAYSYFSASALVRFRYYFFDTRQSTYIIANAGIGLGAMSFSSPLTAVLDYKQNLTATHARLDLIIPLKYRIQCYSHLGVLLYMKETGDLVYGKFGMEYGLSNRLSLFLNVEYQNLSILQDAGEYNQAGLKLQTGLHFKFL